MESQMMADGLEQTPVRIFFIMSYRDFSVELVSLKNKSLITLETGEYFQSHQTQCGELLVDHTLYHL